MQKEQAENEELEIYRQYQDIIMTYIMELEVRDGEYPVEVLNELRSILTHLSRYKLQNRPDELESANRHIKRAILDCYKYLCVSIAESIFKFRKRYAKVDLKLAENGKFLPKLDELESDAQRAFEKAKISEIKNESIDIKYSLYEKAYNAYSEVDKFIEDSREAILFASSHSKKTNRITIASCGITLFSIIVSVILAIVAKL